MTIIDTATAGASTRARDRQHAVLEWLRRALDDESITAEDNFLAVGGHSLMAVSLNGWLAKHQGVAVDLRELFQNSIGRALACARPSK